MEKKKEVEYIPENFRLTENAGTAAELCIEPIIPYINDDLQELEKLIIMAAQAGAQTVRANFLTIPVEYKEKIIKEISRIYPEAEMYIRNIYSVNVGERLYPEQEYCRRVVEMLAAICKSAGIKFCPHREAAKNRKKSNG
jgi:DNA repair photolyase